MKPKVPCYWIKIDKSGDIPDKIPFLLSDEYENVYVGSTSFDYYDAEYWFPMPLYPMNKGIITNDDCISRLIKDEAK